MVNSISVKQRMILLVTVPILVLIGTILLSLTVMQRLVAKVDTLYDDRVVPLKQIKEVSDNYAVNVVDLLHKYRAGTLEASMTLKQIKEATEQADKNWQAYLSTYLTPEEQRLVNESKRLLQPILPLIEKYRKQVASGELRQMDDRTFIAELYGNFDPLSSSLKDLIDLQLRESARLKQQSVEQYQSVRLSFYVSAFIACLLLLVGGWLIYHSIHAAICNFRARILTIAEETDLTVRADVNGNDEFAQMAQGFNTMLDKIHGLVKEVHNAAYSLATASEQMSTISAQVSATTSGQSAQTNEIASSVSQMTSAIEEVSMNAHKSFAQTNQANDCAHQGQETISENIQAITNLAETVDVNTTAISQLNQQTNDITQVVLMIQGVAEQTNLLALNAAIEAARAGESGRGFAVVADEVRQLAHNTQNATTQINDMINKLQAAAQQAVQSMEGVQVNAQESVEHAKNSSLVLEEIVNSVNEIAAMNSQVSTASEQQSTTASAIAENINDFAHSIAEVSSNAENNASASAEVAELATGLQAQVSTFKV